MIAYYMEGESGMDRVILHCDMNSFFASVELLEHPELKDKPVAVCGDPDSRHGIILAKNEPAKKYGIKTAETIWQARKKCPDLIFLPPHMSKYKQFSLELNKIYQRFTDMVEPFSIDESWLDVTASQSLFGTGRQMADSIRQTVKRELGLTLSAGVSFNKIFAKMGSEYKKPDATTEITRENFRELLWCLDAREMFFVGPVMLFNEREKIKSVGNGSTFRRNLLTEDDLYTAVVALSDTVGGRLRKYGMKASGIKVDIKDPHFKVISRQKQLFSPTSQSSEIAHAALEIIHASWKIGEPIRLITITGINLVDELMDEQLSLFSSNGANRERGEKLGHAMDEVRKKYGTGAIGFAAVLDNDIGVGVRADMLEKDIKEK